MPTAPYGVRLLIGVAVTAVEETRKLPQTILMYPMTVASTVAQIVMKVQQDLADLAIKGDAALENIFPPNEEKPDWATFDDDLPDAPAPAPSADSPGERRTEGRFALYSVTNGEGAPPRAAKKAAPNASKPGKAASRTPRPAKAAPNAPRPGEAAPKAPRPAEAAPPVVAELDYDALTLAQLRARMTSLSVDDLRALLAYEENGKARAPFQTLLANRITRATAK